MKRAVKGVKRAVKGAISSLSHSCASARFCASVPVLSTCRCCKSPRRRQSALSLHAPLPCPVPPPHSLTCVPAGHRTKEMTQPVSSPPTSHLFGCAIPSLWLRYPISLAALSHLFWLRCTGATGYVGGGTLYNQQTRGLRSGPISSPPPASYPLRARASKLLPNLTRSSPDLSSPTPLSPTSACTSKLLLPPPPPQLCQPFSVALALC